MKVVCKKDDAKGLDLKEVGLMLDEYEFGVTIGNEYLVMGIGLGKETNSPDYLIDSEDGYPTWYPYMLFDVVDKYIPSDWFIEIYDQESPGLLRSLMGFQELVTSENYHYALIDGQRWALDIYFKREAEVKKYYLEKAEAAGNYDHYL